MTEARSDRRLTFRRGRPWRTALVTLALLVPLLAVAQPARRPRRRAVRTAATNWSAATTVVASPPHREVDRTIPAATLGARSCARPLQHFHRGRRDFGIRDYAFTGAANPEDITGGRFTPVFASKVPDHRGLRLTSAITVELEEEDLEIGRTGTGLSMKIQAKDCAQGGIFQMEPERSNGTLTRSCTPPRHPSAPFYFDNPNFRARVGQFLGADCTSVVTGPPSRFCVQVARGTTSPTTSRGSSWPATAPRSRPGPADRLQHRHPGHPQLRALRRRVRVGRRQRRADGLRHR